MGFEIEHKFLVKGEFKSLATSCTHIRQGYIASGKGRTVRVRMREEVPVENAELGMQNAELLASPLEHSDNSAFCIPNSALKKAYLTIKGPSLNGGLSRPEYEYEIPPKDALGLLLIAEPGIIDKHRYLVPAADGHTWEVDVFHGDNDGLIMAEVELQSEDEPFEIPPFIGREVTGDKRFYNSHMRQNPYKHWREEFEATERAD